MILYDIIFPKEKYEIIINQTDLRLLIRAKRLCIKSLNCHVFNRVKQRSLINNNLST